MVRLLVALALAAPLLAGCGSKCNASNCTGCCDINDTCHKSAHDFCGVAGAACVTCSATEDCSNSGFCAADKGSGTTGSSTGTSGTTTSSGSSTTTGSTGSTGFTTSSTGSTGSTGFTSGSSGSTASSGYTFSDCGVSPFGNNVRRIRMASSGLLGNVLTTSTYDPNTGNAIMARYVETSDCNFSLDSSFSSPSGYAAQGEFAFALDSSSSVYFYDTNSGGTVELGTNGTLQSETSLGSVAMTISPDGDFLYWYDSSQQAVSRATRSAHATQFGRDFSFTYTNPNPSYPITALLTGTNYPLFAAWQNGSATFIDAVNGSGARILAMGNTDTSQLDGLCAATDIAHCKPGLCVVDQSCPKIATWSESGTFAGGINLAVLGYTPISIADGVGKNYVLSYSNADGNYHLGILRTP